MGPSRSTYYDVPSLPTDDAALVAAMRAICARIPRMTH